MDVEKYTIKETDFVGKGVSAQPNPMQKTEEEAKAVFDELVKEVVTPKFNAFVEAFEDVDMTSDKDKPVSNLTQDELDKKVDKEYRTGSEEEYKVLSDNNFTDQEKKDLKENTDNRHSHSNKEVLDGISSVKVAGWDDAYSKRHTHSNKDVLDGISSTKVTNWDDANSKKHSHSNKDVLDGISSTKVTNWDDANSKKHSHSNKDVLDRVTEDTVNKTHEHSNKTVLDGISSVKVAGWDDAYSKRHTHSNKSVLDNISSTKVTNWDDANSKKHSHSNKEVLDGITAEAVAKWNAGTGGTGTAGGSMNMQSITIPRGRMRGDINGDGVIDARDLDILLEYPNCTAENCEDALEFWCADVDGSGAIASANVPGLDYSALRRYLAGETSNFIPGDYYGNWTAENDMFYTDVAVAGITANVSAILITNGDYDRGIFEKIECSAGNVRIFVNRCPVNDVEAMITWGEGSGTIVMESAGETAVAGAKTLKISIPAARVWYDIDGDGMITQSDLTAMENHYLGKELITDETALQCARVDENGKILVNYVAMANAYVNGSFTYVDPGSGVVGDDGLIEEIRVDIFGVQKNDITGEWKDGNVSGYRYGGFYRDIEIEDIGPANNVVMLYNGKPAYEIGCELHTGYIRLLTDIPPAEEMECTLIIEEAGEGEVSVFYVADSEEVKGITHEWEGTTLTITSASGTSSVDLKGEKGDKGDPGETGPTGKTAYEYAKDGGYTGTEEDFKEKMAQEIPEELLLYTAQSLTDSQKAQARGNIGAVGTVEATEEAYTYVFTGEEEVYDAGGGAFYVHMDGVSEEFISNAYNGVLESQGQQVTYAEIFEGKDFRFIKSLQSNDNVHFYTDEYELEIFMCVLVEGDLKVGAYWLKNPESLAVISLTSTVPYTKTTQKIDEALIPDHAHSWEELEDKPFEEIETYTEIMAEQEITFVDDGYGSYVYSVDGTPYLAIPVDSEVTVVFDGVTYNCIPLFQEGGVCIGNAVLSGFPLEDTGEPFCIVILQALGISSAFCVDANTHTMRVDAKSVEIKKIDKKFIDAEWVAYKDTVSVEIHPDTGVTITNGSATSVSTKITSDDINSYFRYLVIWDGTEYELSPSSTSGESGVSHRMTLGNSSLSDSSLGDSGHPFLFEVDARNGKIDVYGSESGSVTFSIFLLEEVPEKLPEEYLPESVSGVIIRSSTEGSAKKFKLTVDDSGTITATEVT